MNKGLLKDYAEKKEPGAYLLRLSTEKSYTLLRWAFTRRLKADRSYLSGKQLLVNKRKLGGSMSPADNQTLQTLISTDLNRQRIKMLKSSSDLRCVMRLQLNNNK